VDCSGGAVALFKPLVLWLALLWLALALALTLFALELDWAAAPWNRHANAASAGSILGRVMIVGVKGGSAKGSQTCPRPVPPYILWRASFSPAADPCGENDELVKIKSAFY
jgi:hypothetical protein